MSVLFTTVYSGVALNTDLTKGVVDRFRSLPIWRPAPLVGSMLGDTVRYLVAGTVIILWAWLSDTVPVAALPAQWLHWVSSWSSPLACPGSSRPSGCSCDRRAL